MPKYISITPTFTPYSVDELMKVPLQIATEAKEQEKVYNDQMDKLAAIEAMAGNNSELQEFMSPYYTARDQAIAAMSSGTYDPNIVNTNKNLRNIWRDRGLKAQAGISAYEAYQKDRPQDAIGGKHSLLEFINNPTLQADYVSGDSIEKTSADIISKLAASLPPSQRGTFLNNSQYLISQGYSMDDIISAMGGNDSQLSQSIASIRNQYGYNNMNDADKDAINKRILNGAMSGLQKYTTATNPDKMTASEALAYKRAQLAYKVEQENYEETGQLKPDKDDKGWVPQPDGTSRKVYSNGNYWEKNAEGKLTYHENPSTTSEEHSATGGSQYNYNRRGRLKKVNYLTADELDEIIGNGYKESYGRYKGEDGEYHDLEKGEHMYYNPVTKDIIITNGIADDEGVNY